MRVVGRQVSGLLVTIWISTVAIFSALSLAPGDPVLLLAGGRQLTPEATLALREHHHLDDPFAVRYWHWLTGVLHGDLGTSSVFREPVWNVLAPRLVNSLLLVTYSALLIILLGVLVGTISARASGWIDSAIMFGTTVGMATPAFVAAVVLSLVFSVWLGWFPVYGTGDDLLDRLWHLTLPAVTLAVGGVALLARVSRAAVRRELASEHVEAARSRGLPEGRVVRRHAVRNAMIPVSTAAGVMVASLLSLTAVVETCFGVSGIGSVLVSSVSKKDFAVVQAVCLIIVVAFAVINAIVDLLYPVIDPRTRTAPR